MKRFLIPALLLLAAACAPKTQNTLPQVPIRTYNAPMAVGPIVIDGILDEADWQNAPLSEAFADIRGVDFEPKPVKQTHMKMLWDNEYLYIAGIIEEDNVTGSLTEHDAIIYHDNDWEVFIDPDQDCRFYFEIELNALNTVMDLLMDRPYREGGKFYLPWNRRPRGRNPQRPFGQGQGLDRGDGHPRSLPLRGVPNPGRAALQRLEDRLLPRGMAQGRRPGRELGLEPHGPGGYAPAGKLGSAAFCKINHPI